MPNHCTDAVIVQKEYIQQIVNHTGVMISFYGYNAPELELGNMNDDQLQLCNSIVSADC